MRITKRQLKQIIQEEVDGHDPQGFMAQIALLETDLVELLRGQPFRSAGVRMALHKLRTALYELKSSMKQELKALETWGD